MNKQASKQDRPLQTGGLYEVGMYEGDQGAQKCIEMYEIYKGWAPQASREHPARTPRGSLKIHLPQGAYKCNGINVINKEWYV